MIGVYCTATHEHAHGEISSKCAASSRNSITLLEVAALIIFCFLFGDLRFQQMDETVFGL